MSFKVINPSWTNRLVYKMLKWSIVAITISPWLRAMDYGRISIMKHDHDYPASPRCYFAHHRHLLFLVPWLVVTSSWPTPSHCFRCHDTSCPLLPRHPLSLLARDTACCCFTIVPLPVVTMIHYHNLHQVAASSLIHELSSIPNTVTSHSDHHHHLPRSNCSRDPVHRRPLSSFPLNLAFCPLSQP